MNDLAAKQQREHFDEVALKAFVRVMGIYPPGSLVQLEDERYALVLGMNPTQALRPTLILYDASVAKHEALIVDLAEDSDLAIARSLRPSQLPLEVLEYLSPRRNLSYHIEPNHERG